MAVGDLGKRLPVEHSKLIFSHPQQDFTFAKQFYEVPVVITTARHVKGSVDADDNAITEWVHVRKIIETAPVLLCFLFPYCHLSF